MLRFTCSELKTWYQYQEASKYYDHDCSYKCKCLSKQKTNIYESMHI